MNAFSPLYHPFSTQPETITITPALVREAGLTQWADLFQLGTAGYRDLLDPEDLHNVTVPFNSLTLAILLEARAQLAREEKLKSLHVGGEVRPHTQELIDLAARIYAAHSISVHLRPPEHKTTPIWLSSFGVYYEELDGGENFTASHSQSYKGGWKPMDSGGGQLLELAGRIAERVRVLVKRASQEELVIRLAGRNDPLIQRDFDPIDPYVGVLRQVLPGDLLAELPGAAAKGFRAAFCTEGGSMAATARRVFAATEIEVGTAGPVFFTHEQESSNYHGIGIVDGVDFGVDPGKWQVYKHVGAQEILRERRAEIFFIWDPDGDRFNMVTTAPATLADTAREFGLEVDPLDAKRCLVFFKPNQIYFMLTAARIESLHAAGALDPYDWIVATTYPTSRSIGELAENFNRDQEVKLKTFRVPVGFKHFAALVTALENQLGQASSEESPTRATDVTGQETVFGPNPRLLIMAEESGGAALGPAVSVVSRNGLRHALAAKEKDAMQIGVLALLLAARLFNRSESYAGYYLELLKRYKIGYCFYERRDVTLFDESLQGKAREKARAAGNRRKEATVAFFADLEGKDPKQVTAILAARLPHDTEWRAAHPGRSRVPVAFVFTLGDNEPAASQRDGKGDTHYVIL